MYTATAEEPEFRDDLGNKLSSVKDPDHRAFRYHDRDGASKLCDRGRGKMAAAETERDFNVTVHSFNIAAGRKNYTSGRYDKRSVQLSQLLYCPAQIFIFNLFSLIGMAGKWIEYEQ